MKKVGRILTSLYLSTKTMIVNVYATSSSFPVQPAYGIPEPEPKINSVVTAIIIPIILLIGIIVFCVKSTSSVLKKVIVSAVIVIVYILIRFLFV